MQKKLFLSAVALGGFWLYAHPANAQASALNHPQHRQPSGRLGYETLRPGMTPSEAAPTLSERPALPPTPDIKEILAGATLQPGQSGPAVEVVRSLLLELDYQVEPAGAFFDRDLSWKIGEFQMQNHVGNPSSDRWGYIDSETLRALQEQSAKGRFNRNLGQSIATYARQKMSGGTGYCYHYVAKALEAYMGHFLNGLHAYMAADQLAASGRFKEIRVPANRLPLLPAGAVVVWDKGSSPSGHISIADGKGNEISDHIQPQMTAHRGSRSYRVFLPLATS